MKKDDTGSLTQLGSAKTKYVYDKPSPELLETFPNAAQHRKYTTEFVFNEWSSLCPKTGQPDFATIIVTYEPKELCIETKSLKMYFLSYRQAGAFMETIVNNILDDLVSICDPHYMQVVGNFNVRGGTKINIEAKHYHPISIYSDPVLSGR